MSSEECCALHASCAVDMIDTKGNKMASVHQIQ